MPPRPSKVHRLEELAQRQGWLLVWDSEGWLLGFSLAVLDINRNGKRVGGATCSYRLDEEPARQTIAGLILDALKVS